MQEWIGVQSKTRTEILQFPAVPRDSYSLGKGLWVFWIQKSGSVEFYRVTFGLNSHPFYNHNFLKEVSLSVDRNYTKKIIHRRTQREVSLFSFSLKSASWKLLSQGFPLESGGEILRDSCVAVQSLSASANLSRVQWPGPPAKHLPLCSELFLFYLGLI